MDDIGKQVKVIPAANVLTLTTGDPAEVTLENTGDQFLTYKLKTTRPETVRPNRTYGVIKPKGKGRFKVKLDPFADDTLFNDKDRVTILVAVLPTDAMGARAYWKSQTAAARPAYRHILQLAYEEGSDDEETDEEEDEEADEESDENEESIDEDKKSEDYEK